jgi:hypothetical protein
MTCRTAEFFDGETVVDATAESNAANVVRLLLSHSEWEGTSGAVDFAAGRRGVARDLEIWQDIHMRSRRRTLIAYKVEYGTPTAGRCSVCYRVFEVELGAAEALSAANERLRALFDAHVCDEDSSVATLRIVPRRDR